MKRKLLLLFIILIAGLYISFRINRHFKIIDLSTVNVTMHDKLDKGKVKIERGHFNGSRQSDVELFAGDAGKWTVFDGHRCGLLHTDYGENDFLITYENKYYLSFRHIITYSRHQHSYNFDFFRRGDSIFVHAQIQGGDEEKFVRPMQLIADAYKSRQDK
jgi:hypothetical protein